MFFCTYFKGHCLFAALFRERARNGELFGDALRESRGNLNELLATLGAPSGAIYAGAGARPARHMTTEALHDRRKEKAATTDASQPFLHGVQVETTRGRARFLIGSRHSPLVLLVDFEELVLEVDVVVHVEDVSDVRVSSTVDNEDGRCGRGDVGRGTLAVVLMLKREVRIGVKMKLLMLLLLSRRVGNDGDRRRRRRSASLLMRRRRRRLKRIRRSDWHSISIKYT